MTALYKFTDRNMKTYGGYQWALGEERIAPGGGPLCTGQWLHAYEDPLVAVLMDPAHGMYTASRDARMFKAEGDVGEREPDGKVGCTRLRLLLEMPLPVVTAEQRAHWAILCHLEVPGSDTLRSSAGFPTPGATRSVSSLEATMSAEWTREWILWMRRRLSSDRSAALSAADAAFAAKEYTGRTLDLALLARQTMVMP